MAFNIYNKIHKPRKYFDKTMYNSYEAWVEQVRLSKTVYVGNLSVYTTDREIYEHMSKVGSIETIIMGLHRIEKTPCGFCFVVYKSKKSSIMAVNMLNETILDGRVIKVDEDSGIIGERRYGRGITGVQRIDERLRRFDFDRPVVIENLIPTDSLNDINDNVTNVNNNATNNGSINMNIDSQKSLYHIKISNNPNNNYDNTENDKGGDYKNNRNDVRDNSIKIINNNNGVDTTVTVITKNSINYNTCYNGEDEESADQKHAKFKAVQRGNRLRSIKYETDKEVNKEKGEGDCHELDKQVPENINKIKNQDINCNNTDYTLDFNGNEVNLKPANVLYPNAKYKEAVETGKGQNEQATQKQET